MKKSLVQISEEIGEWAGRNFKTTSVSQFGILEEVGEASHCIIKRAQAIREMDNPEKFKAKLADALGDIAVYALHFCFVNRVAVPTAFTSDETPVESHAVHLHFMARSAAALLMVVERSSAATQVARLLEHAAKMGKIEGIDSEEALRETWDRVSKRDWLKNPANADKVQEQEELNRMNDDPSRKAVATGKRPAKHTTTPDLLDELEKNDATSDHGEEQSKRMTEVRRELSARGQLPEDKVPRVTEVRNEEKSMTDREWSNLPAGDRENPRHSNVVSQSANQQREEKKDAEVPTGAVAAAFLAAENDAKKTEEKTAPSA